MPEGSLSQEDADPAACPDIRAADVRLAAMNLLARREHSRRELRDKLGRRFGQAGAIDIIEEQVQRLADENLQSDARFAKSYVRQRSERGYGPLRLDAELRERGIDDADVDEALAVAEVDWRALAARVLEKKFGGRSAPDLREKSRRLRFLQYRGFAADHYRHLLED